MQSDSREETPSELAADPSEAMQPPWLKSTSCGVMTVSVGEPSIAYPSSSIDFSIIMSLKKVDFWLKYASTAMQSVSIDMEATWFSVRVTVRLGSKRASRQRPFCDLSSLI